VFSIQDIQAIAKAWEDGAATARLNAVEQAGNGNPALSSHHWRANEEALVKATCLREAVIILEGYR